MPAKSTPAPQKKREDMPRALPLTALLIGLGLSAFNLSLMTSAAGERDGVTSAFAHLQDNYKTRRLGQPTAPPAQEPTKCEEPAPPVMFSIVKFRDNEESNLRMNLAEPLAAFYSEVRMPVMLSAALIERKNASSKDVNVRLFFKDGTEDAFLWPSTNSKDGKWTPPCTVDPSMVTMDRQLCPPMFASRYPDLVNLSR